jgi:hypothetical protein
VGRSRRRIRSRSRSRNERSPVQGGAREEEERIQSKSDE